MLRASAHPRRPIETGSQVSDLDLSCAGVSVRVRRQGAGKPLVFLHGVCGDEAWLPWLAELAHDHEVFAITHPGFGGSAVPEWLASTLDLASFYQELLEQLDLQRVHIVGVDLGGWIALEMGAQTCTRLAAMTLVAPAGVHVAGARKADIFIVRPERLIRDLFVDPAVADAHWTRYQGASETDRDNRLRDAATAARLGWQPYFYRPGLKHWLHRIRIPVNLVWGAVDRMFAVEHAAPIAALLPDARVEIVAECGHLPHIEHQEAFVRGLRRFEEEVRR